MGRKKLQPQVRDKTKLILKGKVSRYHKGDLKIEFKVAKKHALYPRAKDQPILPIFNTDRKYFTPTFVLKNVDTLEDSAFMKVHQKKVDQSLQEFEQGQIMFPCPRLKNKFCAVCRINYEDYKQHLDSSQHKQSSTKSIFQKHINNFCREFQIKNNHEETAKIQKCSSLDTKIQDEECSTEPLIEGEKVQKQTVSSTVPA